MILLCKKPVLTENDKRIARVLILAGADPDLRDNNGITARSLKPELIQEIDHFQNMKVVESLNHHVEQGNLDFNPFSIDPSLIKDFKEYSYGGKKGGKRRKTNRKRTIRKRRRTIRKRRNLK